MYQQLRRDEALPFVPSDPLMSRYERFGKRMLDLVLVLCLSPLAICLVFLIVLPLLPWGRPFYCHQRIGRDRVPFGCWKVRTMVRGAETVLPKVLASDPALRAEWNETRKLTRDPRVTFYGRLLRASRLDELPQLWNVLVGDMSLVGPRPVTAEEARAFGPDHRLVLRVRPGITGAWQVRSRSDCSLRKRLEFDLDYVGNATILRDLGILLLTLTAVGRGR